MDVFAERSLKGLIQPQGARRLARSARIVATSILLLAALISSIAHAKDQEAMDADQIGETVEEIVVIGERAGENGSRIGRLAEDPLRTRIISEIRRLERLEDESEWLAEGARNSVKRNRVTWGYDPRDGLRHGVAIRQTELPFDLFRPAAVFSVEF